MRRLIAVLLAASFLVSSAPPASSGEGSARAWIDPFALSGSGARTAFVHLRDADRLPVSIERARALGLTLGTTYPAIGVFTVRGTPGVLSRLAQIPEVEAVEGNRRVDYFTETSHSATRGQALLDAELTLEDSTVIDGSGVGVAIVDSGIDGTHPDLDTRVVSNVKILCPSHPTSVYVQPVTRPDECVDPAAKVIVPFEDTDTPSAGGHGTHVAGIVAGTGEAAGGRFHGAAPGASLYGVSIGTAVTVENAVDGLRWVLDNQDQDAAPDIRVVNNSWGTGTHARYSTAPDHFQSVTWKMQEALIDAGIVVVQAAGNTAGDGTAATTSPECVNPTPGVICVANYYDHDDGRRSGNIDGSSSRGDAQPEFVDTWPDLSAPGTNITSTCRDTLPVCALGTPVAEPSNSYASMTGTSMAAPHVTGIVAQILQIDPTLTPAQVEELLEDTAYKFTWGTPYDLVDPTNPDDGTSFEKGHGLVDVLAAARVLLLPDGTPEPDPEWPAAPEEPDLGPPGPPQRFFFHATTRVNALDREAGMAAFDEQGPGLGGGGVAAEEWFNVSGADPSWTGAVEGPLQSLQVDFWVKSSDESTHDVGVPPIFHVDLTVGDRTYRLPSFSPSASAPDSVPRRITKQFQYHLVPDGPDEGTAEDLERLNIDTSGQPVTISIGADWFHHAGAIVYDSTDFPSGLSVNMVPPASCSEEDSAPTAQLFLRSTTRSGNLDAAAGLTTLDPIAPSAAEDARIEDVPLARNVVPAAALDPIWRGAAVEGVICSLTLDFWQKQTLDEAILNQVHYYVTVWVGDTPHSLNLVAPGSATSDMTRVTYTFTTMRDDFGNEVPLLIDASTGPVSIELAGQYVDADIETSIFYDSVAHPSSVTIN